MVFLKFSILIIFSVIVVGLMPSVFKFLNNSDVSIDQRHRASASIVNTNKKTEEKERLMIDGQNIPVYVVDTDEKRARGLGGLASIPVNYGMFFIFDDTNYQSIWMKDVLFPIDIVWIDENYKIVHIERNISPNTYPKIFTAPMLARFVLELNEGIAQSYHLKIGQKVTYMSNL